MDIALINPSLAFYPCRCQRETQAVIPSTTTLPLFRMNTRQAP